MEAAVSASSERRKIGRPPEVNLQDGDHSCAAAEAPPAGRTDASWDVRQRVLFEIEAALAAEEPRTVCAHVKLAILYARTAVAAKKGSGQREDHSPA
jgi:hypothetical protein